MTTTDAPIRLRAAFLAALLAPGLLALSGCNQGRRTEEDAAAAAKPLTVAEDPRVQGHIDTFARAEAMITRWDALRNEGRMPEARTLEPKIQAEVDASFPTFVQGTTGSLGPHAQYLAVSGLGFSARPEATAALVQAASGNDARLAGNALIALGVRADPNTPMDMLLNRINPAMPLPVKRYAPLALAKVMEARDRVGYPPNTGVRQQAVVRLGALAVDQDAVTRLHAVRGLQATGSPAAYDYLAVLVGDPQMRVRWAAAGALERLGDPRGFPGVVRLLHDAAPESKHVIRDILVSYAGRMQGRPLTQQEVAALGTGPRAWSQWFAEYRRVRGIPAGGGLQPNGSLQPGGAATAQPRPQPRPSQQPRYTPPPAQPGVVQPAPRPYVPSGGATRGGG